MSSDDDMDDVNVAWECFCRECATETPADGLGGEDVAYATLTRWLGTAAPPPPPQPPPVLHSAIPSDDRFPPLAFRSRTRSFFLSRRLDEYEQMFWHVPVMPYERPGEGVVAKQLRVQLHTPEAQTRYEARVRSQQHPEIYVQELADGDSRFVQVGIYGKQLRIHTRRPRNAFAYCFVVYIRWLCGGDQFRETHVKLFNTGQIDVPGMDAELSEDRILRLLWRHVFAPHVAASPQHHTRFRQFVAPSQPRDMLLNSSFQMDFHINVDTLRARLMQDPRAILFHDTRMTIRCKYVLDRSGTMVALPPDDQWMRLSGRFDLDRYQVVSCRVFWTGSVLISGACSEACLTSVAQHLHAFLRAQQPYISIPTESVHLKKPPKRLHENKSKYVFAADFDPESQTVSAPADLWTPASRGVVVVTRAMWQYFIGVKS